MLLGEVHRPLVGDAQVDGKLLDEEPGQVVVLTDEFRDGRDGNQGDGRSLERRGRCQVFLVGKVSPVGKIFHGLYDTYDLVAAAHPVLEYLNFSRKQAHELRGELAFAVDGFVFAIRI